MQKLILTIIKSNPMNKIRVEKLCLNMGVGSSGDRLTFASMILKDLTDQEPC